MAQHRFIRLAVVKNENKNCSKKYRSSFSCLTTIISSKRTSFYGATANHNDSVRNYVKYSVTLPLKTGGVKYQDIPS